VAGGVLPPRAWRGLLAAASEEWRATPFYRMMLRGADPDRITQWGRDVRVGDFARGMDIVRGQWRIASEKLPVMAPAPWSAPPPSLHFAARLHSFSWLIDVTSVGVSGQEAATVLIDSWVEGFGRDFHAAAWAPELVAERLFAWLCHGRAAFEQGDPVRRPELLRSLARQARHLQLAVQDLREPLARVKAGAALVLAGVSGVPDGDRLREEGEETLEEACASQFLSDGGHQSRSPQALLEAYCDLLTADDALVRQGLETPRLLRDALPRAAAMLRLFRMSDGKLYCANGGGESTAETLDSALREAPKARMYNFATTSGFQRLAAGDVVLMMDVGGAPPPAYGERAHAGALAFELSCGPDRIIVNVGSGLELLPDWRAAGRATNGHSTLVIDDALSAQFSQRRAGRGAAHPVGPTVGQKRTEEDDGVLIDAHHDGYRAQYGYLHRRRVFLSADGRQMWGQDAAAPPLGGARAGLKPVAFAVRFHLHPGVRAERSDVHQMTLTPPNGPAWNFVTDARRMELEHSIYLSAAAGPQRTRQIVLYGVTDPGAPEDRTPNLVKWKLSRVA
jgi:uncharacterized heparinase superfamily protein